jgi:hypothetical protein
MRKRLHAYEEEETCICGGGNMHMRPDPALVQGRSSCI